MFIPSKSINIITYRKGCERGLCLCLNTGVCATVGRYVEVSEYPQVWILASLLETESLLFSCFGVPGCRALKLRGRGYSVRLPSLP